MMKKYLILSILTVFILNGCQKDEDSSSEMNSTSINGFVQKGPFLSGTSISINELTTDLSQTGKVFNTQIADNSGRFGVGTVGLVSNYVSLRADGFYFNENIGEQSSSQITLYALSDISNSSTLNVNVLSHLEKSRVEYLISQGLGFDDAKAQAQEEILDVFNINTVLTESSEILDITEGGESNAILLATSVILQGYRTEAQLTELLSNISADLRVDGVLNSNAIGSELINHAVYLDTVSIRNNIENRYANLGVNAVIPNFEKYVKSFIDSSSFEVTESLIEYPSSGAYGQNILDLENENYTGSAYSLAANLSYGTELKIKITGIGDAIWFYSIPSQNWLISNFDEENRTQYFTAIHSDQGCDLQMEFDSGEFLIEYFEMGATQPRYTKTVSIP